MDNSQRDLHGALLDAEILADVYLAMTGGQVSLSLDSSPAGDGNQGLVGIRRLSKDRPPLPVVRPGRDEMALHQARLDQIDQASGDGCLWRKLEGNTAVE